MSSYITVTAVGFEHLFRKPICKMGDYANDFASGNLRTRTFK